MGRKSHSHWAKAKLCSLLLLVLFLDIVNIFHWSCQFWVLLSLSILLNICVNPLLTPCTVSHLFVYYHATYVSSYTLLFIFATVMSLYMSCLCVLLSDLFIILAILYLFINHCTCTVMACYSIDRSSQQYVHIQY